MSLSISDDVHAAIKSVRDDKSEDDFVLAGYGEGNDLVLIGSGKGGVEALKDLLLENDICYGLVRKAFTWEKVGQVQADTTKFIFITWRPDSIPLKRKMMIGKNEGKIKKLFQAYHTTMDINTADEISEEILNTLIADITMTADKRTTRKSNSMFLGGKRLSWKKGSAEKKIIKPESQAYLNSAPKGAAVHFQDEEELKQAIADVRNDSHPSRWCVATYVSKDTIALSGTGEGDVSELLEKCTDSKVSYGIFRVTEQFDKTQATRFCFVVWTPDFVPPMEKARISTHKGEVAKMFRPFMQDFYISEKSELSEEIALEKISGLTGTRSHVTTRKEVKEVKKYERKFLGGVKSEIQNLEFENKQDIMVAIADVRSDKSSTNWCVSGFMGEKQDVKLCQVASGSGGIEEMVDAFDDNKIMYGLLRNEETYDRSTVVRFYYFKWEGQNVSMTTKGHIGIFSGAVNAIYSPFNNDIYGTSVEDIIDNAKKKIQNLF